MQHQEVAPHLHQDSIFPETVTLLEEFLYEYRGINKAIGACLPRSFKRFSEARDKFLAKVQEAVCESNEVSATIPPNHHSTSAHLFGWMELTYMCCRMVIIDSSYASRLKKRPRLLWRSSYTNRTQPSKLVDIGSGFLKTSSQARLSASKKSVPSEAHLRR